MSSIIGDDASFTMSEYPDALISALQKDRNSMVDSFVDEAVRFYSLLLVYPWMPLPDAMRLCKGGYKVSVEAKDLIYTVTITREVSE